MATDPEGSDGQALQRQYACDDTLARVGYIVAMGRRQALRETEADRREWVGSADRLATL